VHADGNEQVYKKVETNKAKRSSEDACDHVARAIFGPDAKLNSQQHFGNKGICIEDPRKCPMTKDSPTMDERTLLKTNDAFKKMHVGLHNLSNSAAGHGYCQICNLRFCKEGTT